MRWLGDSGDRFVGYYGVLARIIDGMDRVKHGLDSGALPRSSRPVWTWIGSWAYVVTDWAETLGFLSWRTVVACKETCILFQCRGCKTRSGHVDFDDDMYSRQLPPGDASTKSNRV